MSTGADFVSAVKVAVHDSAIDGVIRILIQPPGRNPRARLLAVSNWYNGLGESDRRHVDEVIRLSVHDAVFGFLAALDGSRSLGFDRLSLQGDGIDLTAEHDLHDNFQALVATDLF